MYTFTRVTLITLSSLTIVGSTGAALIAAARPVAPAFMAAELDVVVPKASARARQPIVSVSVHLRKLHPLLKYIVNQQITPKKVLVPGDEITRVQSTSWRLASPYGILQKASTHQPRQSAVKLKYLCPRSQTEKAPARKVARPPRCTEKEGASGSVCSR
jgi:hypothetical protein